MTQRGSCDLSYSFAVNVSYGIVTHPNLAKFKGYVAKSGSVRASVTVQDKFASGTAGFRDVRSWKKGAAAREVRNARAIKPRNAIDRFKKRNTVLRTTSLREAASDTIAMPATLLFAHGKPRNEQLLPPNDIARIGIGHERVLRKPSQMDDNS